MDAMTEREDVQALRKLPRPANVHHVEKYLETENGLVLLQADNWDAIADIIDVWYGFQSPTYQHLRHGPLEVKP